MTSLPALQLAPTSQPAGGRLVRSGALGAVALVESPPPPVDCAQEERLFIPANPHAAVLARAFVQTHLCAVHRRGSVSDITLMVSELVTRAVLGGVRPVEVQLFCTADGPTVMVSDVSLNGGGLADPRLLVASRVAKRWGRAVVEGEVMVWCTANGANSAEARRGGLSGRNNAALGRKRVTPPWA